MIVASGIALQTVAKPLFSDVSVRFGGRIRYMIWFTTPPSTRSAAPEVAEAPAPQR